MAEYETLTLSRIVLPEGDPIYSQRATIVAMDDESGGAFVRVKQELDDRIREIAINPDEWPSIRDAIDAAVSECARFPGPKGDE